MGFINWMQENWYVVGAIVYMLMSAAGQIAGFFNGPNADGAKGIIERLLQLLRGFGFGTYKDEPGTNSLPFVGDSGLRVVTVESAKPSKEK